MSNGRISETDEKIAQAVGVALNTVRNVRRKCVTLGLKVAVYGQNEPNPHLRKGRRESTETAPRPRSASGASCHEPALRPGRPFA